MKEIPLVDYIANVSVFLLFAWFCFSILKSRKPVISTIIGVLTMGIGGTIADAYFSGPFLFAFAIGGFFLYLYLGFEGTLKEKIIVYCLGYIMVTIAQTASGAMFGILGLRYEDHALALLTVSGFFGFALLFLVSRVWKSISVVLGNVRYMTFFLLPISQFLMMMVFVYHFSKKNGSDGATDLTADYNIAVGFFVVFILSLIADGFFIDGMAKMAQSIQERERLQALEMESQLTYEYIKSMENDINEMSKYRHDFVNTLTAAGLAIENDAVQGKKDAMELIRQMTEGVTGVTGKCYCGCNLVNCILSREEKRMTSGGIMCDLRAEVPEKLGVGELDLCRVLTNMFDNAERSCLKIEDAGKRHVSANMRVCDGYLYITVINTCPKGDFSLETDKEDKKLHGLGLKIIRQIAGRNDGEMMIDREEDTVRVTVTMAWKD